MHDADAALERLIETLGARGYRFVTPTPATHARVVARPDRREARDLADVLGWSLAFAPEAIDADIVALLEQAGALLPRGAGRMASRYRVSSLRGGLYLHSAYPTEAEDAVFFGPDSYRFADLIAAELERAPLPPRGTIVDIGTGAGVGALAAASLCAQCRVLATDINPKALRLARINARAAGVTLETLEAEDLAGVPGAIDLALANPPYIIDDADRAYRNGGGMFGGEVSLRMAEMAVARLAPGGRLILYTGSAIVRGEDPLGQALRQLAATQRLDLRYRELDPDVFGEELDAPAYAQVDRIAVVAAVFTKR
jgi:methylase of polypeptide subunit release factors